MNSLSIDETAGTATLTIVRVGATDTAADARVDVTGGIGLDLHLLRDRVEITTDLYRFGEDVYPRLKELLAIEFLRHVYIVGGINDILNENRDYFVGAMLRFNDEDLKTMLTFAPSP